MNSKAIRKQLLAAVAMVLVAAVALGSSTYAWFVASGTVTAEGMNVQVQSEAGIVIRYGNSVWGTTATATTTTDEAKLYPASSQDLKNWYHSAAKQANESTSTGTYDNITTQVLNNDNTYKANSYVLMKKFQIRSSSDNIADVSKGLYVSDIQVTYNNEKPTENMATAIRVGVRVPAGQVNDGSNGKNPEKVVIFAPTVMKTNPNDSNNKPSASYSVNKNQVPFSPVTTYSQATATILDSNYVIPSGKQVTETETTYSGMEVEVYVWFEGEDHNLYSDNISTKSLDISVNFTAIAGGKQASAGA